MHTLNLQVIEAQSERDCWEALCLAEADGMVAMYRDHLEVMAKYYWSRSR